MTHDPVPILLDALAVARLTRLVTQDTITAPLREKIAGRRPGRVVGQQIVTAARPKLAELTTCPWCVSPYLAAAVVALQALAPAVCLVVTAVLAFSMVAGLLAERA